jgi:hypothetical protein
MELGVQRAFESFNPEPSATVIFELASGLAVGSGLNDLPYVRTVVQAEGCRYHDAL